jgi:outer membrane protein OmpA-like peptidoglycan-associated protein
LGAGCASTPKQVPELNDARAEVLRANSDPLAQEAAGVRLKKANEALSRAEDSFAQHKPLPDILHQSYLATRQAQIAEAQTSELRSRKEVEQGEADRNRVLLEARTTEAAIAEAAAARAKSDAATANSNAATANSNAAAANSNAAAQAAATRDQLAAAAEESARLRAELEDLHAKQTERGMVLTLGDVLFDTGKTTIKPGAMLTVNRLAEFLRMQSTLNVMIEGHTDSMGTDEYNLDLSQRRADAVRTALVTQGIPNERILSRGLGKSYPTASNDSAGGRQQNRRVEVVFSDAKGQFSPAAERLTKS